MQRKEIWAQTTHGIAGKAALGQRGIFISGIQPGLEVLLLLSWLRSFRGESGFWGWALPTVWEATGPTQGLPSGGIALPWETQQSRRQKDEGESQTHGNDETPPERLPSSFCKRPSRQ